MSESFQKALVKDGRLGCIMPKVKFQVLKGDNINCEAFEAISETEESHVCNVRVPSLETVLGGEVLWQATAALKIARSGKPADTFAENYGVAGALAPFPIQSLATTMTATINENAVSQNMMETLPI